MIHITETGFQIAVVVMLLLVIFLLGAIRNELKDIGFYLERIESRGDPELNRVNPYK